MNILLKMLGAAAFVSLAAFSLGTEMALARGAKDCTKDKTCGGACYVLHS
jgi:hypothetical protein